ncbi:MAG: IPT/TIG domain-containing protein [Planctomycetota bacterium]
MPTISAISPALGPAAGGTAITVTGTSFAPGATVSIALQSATVTSVTPTSIVAVTPAGTVGPQTLVVGNVDGRSATQLNGFTYQGPAPTLASVSPTAGTSNGGVSITLTGTNFTTGGATVTLGGFACTSVAVNSATQIVCTTPNTFQTVGPLPLTVTNIDGQSVTLAAAYGSTGPAPTVTSVNPASGTTGGGTVVTLGGTNFFPGVTITIGGAAATGLTIIGPTQLTCVSPAGTAGARNIVVTNLDGQSVTSTGGYTYVGGPTVSSVSPNTGAAGATTFITITGANFAGSSTVTVGGAPATGVTVVNTTTITCTTPTGTVGPATVAVTDPGPPVTATLVNGFTYTGATPVAGSFTPASGPAAGGTAVTITGSNFVAGATVTIGGVAATMGTVTATQIIATTNAASPGPGTVVVFNPDGQSGTAAATFNFLGAGLGISSINPTSGPVAGGTTVTITGAGFLSGATVTFGGVAAPATVVSSTLIVATTQAGPQGPALVVVTNVDGQNSTHPTWPNGWRYEGPAPTLTSVSPAAGTNGGGTTITLTGTNFAPFAQVRVNGVVATNRTFLSSTTVTAVTPAIAPAIGPVNVTITNVDNLAATLTGGFNALGLTPTVQSTSPATAPNSGGATVTLTGTNFVTGATVELGGVPAASVSVVSSTSAVIVVPNMAPALGPHDVTVTNVDSQAGTLAGGLLLQGTAPTLTAVAPATVAHTGGTLLTLTGSNFATGATVTVNGTAATTVTVVSATQITATMPNIAPVIGPVAVAVTNTDTQSAALPASLTAQGPAPVPTAVTPGSGPLAGGTVITVTGSGFASGATVSVGGAAATMGTVTASTITATTPAGAIGPATVTVHHPDGRTGALAGGFLFEGPAPTLSTVNPAAATNAGGTTITLTGTNFAAGATVTVGGTAATTVVVVSGTSLTCTTPALAPVLGPVAVVVTNVDGRSASLPTGFTAQAAAPTLTTVSPASGTTGGGTFVTLTGTNFFGGAAVTVGGVAATSVTVVNSTTITCWTPAGSAGAAAVVVTNLDAQNAQLATGYTFTGGPQISAINPNSGAATANTTITITGTNFASGVTVTVGGTLATSVVLTGTTQIVCNTPTGAVGPAAVVVTNPSGPNTTAPAGFTYTGPAPTFSSVNPSSGPAAGGTLITITGTNFVAGATVAVGGAAATSVGFVNGTTLTAVTPAGTAGSAAILVTNPDANSVNQAAAFTFTVVPPNPQSVTPAVGPLAGSTLITITGSNFHSGATVSVGGSAASMGAVAPNTITATTPAGGAAGPANVTVHHPDGQSQSLPGGHVYQGPAPTLTLVQPGTTAAAGGATLTLTGTNFVAGATVTVGGVAATGVTVVSGSSITCTMPAVTPLTGALAVTVTNVDLLNATLATGVTATGPVPTLTAVSPGGGPNGGGTLLNLTGTNFTAGATVTVGGVAASNVTVLSATQITAVSPSLAPAIGAQTVQVVLPDTQTATLAAAFIATGPTPSIASVSPAGGPNGGGTLITITGANFVAGATVTVGGVAASGVSVVSANSITATTASVAPAVGPVAVVVTNIDSGSDTLAGGFLASGAAPTLTTVNPASGPNGGGTTITLTGTNFAPGATVTVGGTAATGVTVVSATSITCTTPALAPALGPVAVVATNLDTQSAALPTGFNALAAAPTLTAVNPNTGTTGGGTLITLTGTNFVAGATVTVGGATAGSVTVVSGTTITCWTPAGAAGAAAVVVTNLDAQSAQQATGFSYSSGPLISTVNVTTGPTTGGTPITITGTGFISGSTVSIGGAAATAIVVSVPTQITCTTPAGTAGAANVTVHNSASVTTTRVGGFTYTWPANAQTAAYLFDTASGIDCRRRWFVNFGGNAFLKDLQNRGLQSWGTPGDGSTAPGSLPAVDDYARDWARAYVLRTLNIAYGRNGDGTKVSGTSINITFVGLTPGSGARGCGTPATDYSEIAVSGCDPNGNGGPHPNASQAACNSGTVGRAGFDNIGGGSCNLGGEHNANPQYHGCATCGPTGVFTANLGNLWGQTLAGGPLQAGDLQFLDGTTTSGTRFNQIHDHLQQFARRIAFVVAHEIGHSVGLVAASTTGTCGAASGGCGSTQGHNNCCSNNIMSQGFSSLPGGPTAGAGCSGSGAPSSYALLQAYCGTSP